MTERGLKPLHEADIPFSIFLVIEIHWLITRCLSTRLLVPKNSYNLIITGETIDGFSVYANSNWRK